MGVAAAAVREDSTVTAEVEAVGATVETGAEISGEGETLEADFSASEAATAAEDF